jgi:hypothetical protein
VRAVDRPQGKLSNSTKLKNEVSDFLVGTLPLFPRNTSEYIDVPHSRLNPVHIQISFQKCDIAPKRQSYLLPFNRSHPNATTHHVHYTTQLGSTRQWCCGAVRSCLVDLRARGGLLLLLLGGHGRRSGGLLFLHKQRVGKVTAMLVWRLRDTESDANEVAAGKSRRHCAFQRSGIHCARLAEI